MSTAQLRCEDLANVDRIWHLRRTGLVDGISPSELSVITAVCEDRIYAKGEIIFNQGDPADSLFILNRGYVKIAIVNDSDQEKVLGMYTTGAVFGEDTMGPQEYFQTQSTAEQEAWVFTISRDQFVCLLQQRGAIALNCIRILSQRLLEAREDVEASFLSTERRLGKRLLKLAETLGKPVCAEKHMIKLKIAFPHQELAHLIGANRPHVSTIMSKFKKRGWVLYQGRRLVLNVEELERVFKSWDPIKFSRTVAGPGQSK